MVGVGRNAFAVGFSLYSETLPDTMGNIQRGNCSPIAFQRADETGP